MHFHKPLLILSALLLFSCSSEKNFENLEGKSRTVKELIDAVNKKDAEKYVAGFADSVQIIIDGSVVLQGRNKVLANRANHFQNHPEIRSEILHIVEIEDRVVLHDQVWLNNEQSEGQNIVEIFTFENDKVTKMEVIQPKNLVGN